MLDDLSTSAANPVKSARLTSALWVPVNTDPLVSLWMLVLPASDSVMFMPGRWPSA
jgi:hypothetical protein